MPAKRLCRAGLVPGGGTRNSISWIPAGVSGQRVVGYLKVYQMSGGLDVRCSVHKSTTTRVSLRKTASFFSGTMAGAIVGSSCGCLGPPFVLARPAPSSTLFISCRSGTLASISLQTAVYAYYIIAGGEILTARSRRTQPSHHLRTIV